MRDQHEQFDAIDARVASSIETIDAPQQLDCNIRQRIQRIRRHRRILASAAGFIILATGAGIFTFVNRTSFRPSSVRPGEQVIVQHDASIARDDFARSGGSSSSDASETTRATVRVRNSGNHIVVESESSNPSISIFMIYQAEHATADAGDGERPQSTLSEKEPGV